MTDGTFFYVLTGASQRDDSPSDRYLKTVFTTGIYIMFTNREQDYTGTNFDYQRSHVTCYLLTSQLLITATRNVHT